MKKQNIKEIIYQVKQGKKIMEKLNKAQKCSILGPQNLGSRGPQAPEAPWICTCGGKVLTERPLKHHVSIKPILFVQTKQGKCPDPC